MSATGFSYAQAARGQTAPLVNTTVASSTTPSPVTSEDYENFGSTTISDTGTVLVLCATTDASKLASSESGSGSRKVDSDAGSATDSATLIGTLAESTSNLSLDDVSAHVTTSFKNDHVSALATRSSSSDDGASKGRKGKAANTAGKDADLLSLDDTERGQETVRVILSPAPVPVKNIWDERRRELAAKSKQIPIAPSQPDLSVTATGVVDAICGIMKSKDPKNSSAPPTDHETSTETNGPSTTTKPQPRRLSETSRADPTRRNGSRLSRVIEKDAKNPPGRSVLPLVQDTTLWPTPESAAVTEDPKAKGLAENADRIDNGDKDNQEEGTLAKSRRKGAWVTLDFVPTVNFQTPLPNVRGSKPKTGARGGRDSSSRGAYSGVTNGSTEKMLPTTSSPVDKAAPEFRDRPREANGSATTTRPHIHSSNPAKRFSIDSTHTRETRKSLAVADHDRPKDAVSNYSGVS